MFIRPTNPQYLLAHQPLVAGIDVGRKISPGQVAQMKGAVGVG
jgi:hypothetical protein